MSLANDIVNCKVEDLDSLLKKNRPVTNMYLDSILVTNPSNYFKKANDYFNQDGSWLTLKGGNYDKGFYEYYITYKVGEYKGISFTFVKKKENWILIEILPKNSIDFIK